MDKLKAVIESIWDDRSLINDSKNQELIKSVLSLFRFS